MRPAADLIDLSKTLGTKVPPQPTRGSQVLCLATFNKGDPDVQPEPESGPAAKSETWPEVRPAAGRWPKTRTATAGSEPPGAESEPAGQGWRLIPTERRECRKIPPKGGIFLNSCASMRHGCVRASARLDLPGNLNYGSTKRQRRWMVSIILPDGTTAISGRKCR